MHPCVLAIIALTTSYSIFLEHYLIPYIPALALLLGWRISQIDSEKTQKILIFAILIATLSQDQLPMLKTPNPHRLENWRSAASRVNEVLLQEPSALVILRSGFVESEYRSLSAQEDALFAPNLVYPLKTTNIIRLPRQLNPQTEEYLQTIGTPTLTSHDRIIFLGKRLNFPKEYVPFLASLLHPAGFTLTEENFGTVQLATFKRNHTRISGIK